MSGLTGVLGGNGHAVGHLADRMRWSERESEATDRNDGVEIHVAYHPLLADDQPLYADDALVWLLGEVYGFEDESGYTARPMGTDSVEYCANLYEQHGREFLAGLNGNFAGVIYDTTAEEVSVFVDRLGSQPIFCARPAGQFVFSTQIQTLTDHPAIEPAFDLEYLFEYLTFRRVFGVETPLRGITKLHPASITTYDLASDSVGSEVYWEPRFRPVDRPFESIVDEFVETFRTVVDDWLARDRECGLLLSGGSDSRLILAAADQRLTAFHLADWWSEEAQTAQEAARTAGADFELLRRTDSYYEDMLQKNASLSNFDGYFFQGYLTPFEDEVVGSVDALMSGLYADTLFKSESIPTHSLSLGPLGTVPLPVAVGVESPWDVLEQWIEESNGPLPSTPAYFDVHADMHDILSRNVTEADGRITHHGVTYDSLAELVVANRYYPLSNDSELIYQNSLRQLCPYRTPYLDNRLVDLHLTVPKRYRLRHNLIEEAIGRIDPELAAIPHASTGVSMAQSYPRRYLAQMARAFRRKFSLFDGTPAEPYHEHGPWRNHAAYLRHEDFVIDAIRGNEDTIQSLPLLDRDGVETTHSAHRAGENRTAELFTLLTLLEMPVTDAVGNGGGKNREQPPVIEGCRR